MKDYLKKISEQMSESGDILFLGLDSSKIRIDPEDLSPGDVVAFSYKGSQYSALIVSTKKTGRNNCSYISGKNNKLLTTIKINFNLQIHTMFLSKIYNDQKKADYGKLSKKNSPWLKRWFTFSKKSRKETILKGIMGKNNFRSFIIPEIKQLVKLNLGV